MLCGCVCGEGGGVRWRLQGWAAASFRSRLAWFTDGAPDLVAALLYLCGHGRAARAREFCGAGSKGVLALSDDFVPGVALAVLSVSACTHY